MNETKPICNVCMDKELEEIENPLTIKLKDGHTFITLLEGNYYICKYCSHLYSYNHNSLIIVGIAIDIVENKKLYESWIQENSKNSLIYSIINNRAIERLKIN
jgi:hypothetical protein